MDDREELERARQLAMEAIAICDTLGYGLAAVKMQMGLDLLTPDGLREDPLPWGKPKGGPRDKS